MLLEITPGFRTKTILFIKHFEKQNPKNIKNVSHIAFAEWVLNSGYLMG